MQIFYGSLCAPLMDSAKHLMAANAGWEFLHGGALSPPRNSFEKSLILNFISASPWFIQPHLECIICEKPFRGDFLFGI